VWLIVERALGEAAWNELARNSAVGGLSGAGIYNKTSATCQLTKPCFAQHQASYLPMLNVLHVTRISAARGHRQAPSARMQDILGQKRRRQDVSIPLSNVVAFYIACPVSLHCQNVPQRMLFRPHRSVFAQSKDARVSMRPAIRPVWPKSLTCQPFSAAIDVRG
jgi:hypothetical protein